MPKVAAVRLAFNPKTLWFDPNGVEFVRGDHLIVKTERGQEFGTADDNLKEVDEEALSKLKSSLKPVIRRATAEDEAKWAALQDKSVEALAVFKDMAAEQGLDMRPVAVEYLFDGDKAIFYFESEQRVDFRELVRCLASRFHVRIDMRQIGVRDEARIVGGYGHCGQELCCARMGGHFNPVSIRMAKDQDLSLNPTKISGVCGRLMCCLRYEADAYKEFKCHCPKHGATIKTPKGPAKVVEINVPRETVTLQLDDKRVRVPVADMEVDEKTGRPNAIGAEALDESLNKLNSAGRVSEIVDNSMFTGTDKLADAPVARYSEGFRARAEAAGGTGEGESKGSSRRRRRSRSASGKQSTAQQEQQANEASSSGRSRRRRSSSKATGGAAQKQAQDARKQQPRKDSRNTVKPKKQSGKRPGQNSSALSASKQTPAAENQHRRSRRRTHKAQGSEGSAE